MFESWWTIDIGLALAILFHIVMISISIILTVHILLHKSDPKASLMWIAIVWFAPVFGAIFYLMFGINRISRRAAKMWGMPEQDFRSPTEYEYLKDESTHDFGIENHRLGNNVTNSHRTHGNQIEVIEGVENIHQAMRFAIESAESSIALSTYIFKNNDLGKTLAFSLIQAKERGVDVRVLLDGVGNGPFRSGVRRALISGGVEVQRFFHGFWPWQMTLLNMRNHRKFLIVDGKVAFTGSLNIGRVRNLETHFKIAGPLLKSMAQTFEKDWKISGGTELSDKFKTVSSSLPGSISARGVRSGPIYQNERLRWIILSALSCARREIRILTPYFIPDRGLLAGLKLAALRGVDVEIILPKSSNYPFADWAAVHQLTELLEVGCHIYYREDLFDHSKLMVIDQHWALIGSSNWDARSIRLNFEYDVECEGPEFATKLNKLITQRRHKSEALHISDLENQSVIRKIRNASARLLLPYL